MPSKTKETKEKKEAKKSTTSQTSNKKKAQPKKTEVKKKNTVENKAKNAKKSTTAKKTTVRKNSTVKKSNIKKKSAVKKVTKPIPEIVEYYDLPYRYNETIVKTLYQTPNTLFVYWDISDTDRKNYIEQYGENFFNITRPVLIIHNDTMNYSFEIPINDFANCWYFNVNDSKCNYRVELGRKPNYYNEKTQKEFEEKIHTDYIYISNSNEIESPNDHVLYNTDNVKIRNIKNHVEHSVSLYDIVKRIPILNKNSNIPYINKDILKDLYSGIYQSEDITLFNRISNPSSRNIHKGE